MAIEITDEIVKAFRTAELRALQIQGFHYGNDFVIRDLRKNVTEQEILRYPDADQEGFVDAILALRAKDTLNAVAPLIEAQVSAKNEQIKFERETFRQEAVKLALRAEKAEADLAQARADAIQKAADKVILPKQPTSEMLEAGLKAVSGAFDEDPKATAWDALRFYRAMIAAAQEKPHV